MKGTNKMTDKELENYMELIALNQERYDYEDAIELIYVITSIFGYNENVLDSVNYYLTGYRDYEQLKEYSQYD